MARLKKLSELESLVRWQADQEHAELRHTPEAIRRAINQSIQDFREAITANGDPYYLTNYCGKFTPGQAVDPSGTGRVFEWGVIDTTPIDPEIVRIYGIDVSINGITVPMDHVGFARRNDYTSSWGTSGGYPVGFFTYDENKIGVVPYPSSAHEYTIWYLPRLPELTNDEDEFNPGVPGAEEWIVWDLLFKLLARDNYPRLVGLADAERTRRMDDIVSKSTKHQRVGPISRMDTRFRSALKRRGNYRWGIGR